MTYKIKFDNLVKYLSSLNWIIEDIDEKLSKIKKIIGNKERILIIPKDENLEDYDFRINRLIKSLSILEKKDIKEIYDKINNIGFDIIKFRFKSAKTEKGTFPLVDFPKAMENIRNVLKFGACSEIRPESQYRRPFKLAKELINTCEIGQTEVGSFVVNVKVPSKQIIDNEETEIGRKTVTRLIEGISEINNLDLDNEENFKENYDKKLNKNVFDALSNLLVDEETFDLELNAEWDSSNQEHISEVSKSEIKSSEQFKRLNKLSGYLKKIPQSETTTIRGLINIMKHTDINSSDEKRLIIVSDEITKRKVYVLLEETNYQEACNAHRDTKKVKVKGYLNKKQVHWVLDNPEEFEVIENPTSS